VVLQDDVTYGSYPHGTIELVVLNHLGVKLVGHQDVIPVVGGVVVFHQPFYFIRMQMPPTTRRRRTLLVPQVIIVLAFREVLWCDEVVAHGFGRE